MFDIYVVLPRWTGCCNAHLFLFGHLYVVNMTYTDIFHLPRFALQMLEPCLLLVGDCMDRWVLLDKESFVLDAFSVSCFLFVKFGSIYFCISINLAVLLLL